MYFDKCTSTSVLRLVVRVSKVRLVVRELHFSELLVVARVSKAPHLAGTEALQWDAVKLAGEWKKSPSEHNVCWANHETRLGVWQHHCVPAVCG